MTDTSVAVAAAAVSLGVVHTLLGPDHYLPFVAMARAGQWSTSRTLRVTLLCGVGHVLGSVVIGLAGVAAGLSVFRIETVEALRGNIAGWMLLALGLLYSSWGLWRGLRGRPHSHLHVHEDGTVHAHEHSHHADHLHVHDDSPAARPRWTPWVLFTIFLFGPCEPLIALLIVPAAQGQLAAAFYVTALFAFATLTTMLLAVLALRHGLVRLQASWLDRFGHAFAGVVIVICGIAVKAGA